MKAIWNNQIIAGGDGTIVLENNHYFPAESIKEAFLKERDTHTSCPWNGLASYKSVVVNGKTNKVAAWYYPNPKVAAKGIAGYHAFWKGIKIKK